MRPFAGACIAVGWVGSNPNGIPSFSPGSGRVSADLPRVTCVCEIQPQRGCSMRVAGPEEALQSKPNPVGVGTGGGLVPRGSPAFAGQPRAGGQNAVGVPAWPRTSQLSDESFCTPAIKNPTRELCPKRTSWPNHVVRLSTLSHRERRGPGIAVVRLGESRGDRLGTASQAGQPAAQQTGLSALRGKPGASFGTGWESTRMGCPR